VTLRTTALHAEHERLGAKMVAFGGFEMPLSYPAGTLAEHLACRREAALFDVSHLGTVRVKGAEAFDLLQRSLSNDLGKIAPGRAQYTHLLDDEGGVLDDIIVWWLAEESFEVMPNASNTERVLAALAGRGAQAEDVTEGRAVLALQGPRARQMLEGLVPEAASVGRFRLAPFCFDAVQCTAAGTGYTGEDGVELSVPAEAATKLWRAVIAAGAEPAGLGARDTLRLEAGLPLHGHELGPGITPFEAGLDWVIGWDKGDFRGRRALEATLSRGGPTRRLRGVLSFERRPPRAGDGLRWRGELRGAVTSGNYSPILGRGIALGFLPAEAAIGDAVEIEMRSSSSPARVVQPPFHRLEGQPLEAPSQ
jgi:aminomethyltransferase